MPAYFHEVKTVVRMGGRKVSVSQEGSDKCGWRDGDDEFHCFEKVTGSRRARQIAKRHWIKQEEKSFSSQHFYKRVSRKLPASGRPVSHGQ